MSGFNQKNRHSIEFTPPEAVAISFAIAPFGSRVGAQMLDLLITISALALIIFLLLWSWIFPVSVSLFIAFILSFLVRVPYYVFSELVWNGRTLGKKIVGIRVINKDGRRLTPHQIVARNLMKEAELFSPLIAVSVLDDITLPWKIVTILWVVVLLLVVLLNRQRQRLGDMVAGTVVVQNPRSKLLPDLALTKAAAKPTFEFLDHHLDIYGRFELQTLEDILREAEKSRDTIKMEKLTRTIIHKINYTDPVRTGEELLFLNEFYRAQREHLEKLRLFGNKRENKHHVLSVTSPDGAVAPGAKRPEFEFLDAHLDIYGLFELQALEKILREAASGQGQDALPKIARAIITKINYAPPVKNGEEAIFLSDFYRAQHAWLENQRRAGKVRERKK